MELKAIMETTAIYAGYLCIGDKWLPKILLSRVWKVENEQKNDRKNRSNYKNLLQTSSKHFAWYVFARVDTN